MIGQGVSSRSSHSAAAGRTTCSAKPWTQSRMSRWSSESSNENGGDSIGSVSGGGCCGGFGSCVYSIDLEAIRQIDTILVRQARISNREFVTNNKKRQPLPDQPWAGLPRRRSADALRPGIPQLSDEIIDAIRDGVPGLRPAAGGSVRRRRPVGVEQALIEFVDLVEKPDRDRSAGREVYVRLGRGEARAGRTMEALLAAYRIGARVAWRRVAEAARAAALGEEVLARLAESIFAYIDELPAASAEGHAQEQAAAAGESAAPPAPARHADDPVACPRTRPPSRTPPGRPAGRCPRSLAALVWRQAERRIADPPARRRDRRPARRR